MKDLKKVCFALILGAGVSASVNAGVIDGQLFNTGLNAEGAALSSYGGVDAHWTVDGAAAITYAHPAYAANDADSQWVSSNAWGGNETSRATTYLYSTTFDLTGYDASSASLSGLWGADNYGSIYLNGIDTGNSLSFGYDAFRTLHAFTIDDYFVNGVNTLTVELTNGHLDPTLDPGPGAMRMDNLSLTATAVPEPGTLALLSLGFAGLLLARRSQS